MENNNWQNWGEQPQQQQPQQEQPQINWGEQHQPQQEQPQNINNIPTSDTTSLHINSEKSYSYLGGVDLLKVKNELYYLKYTPTQILGELQSHNLNPIGNDGLYQTTFTQETQLGGLVSSIGNIAKSKGLELTSTLVKKLQPSESSLNIIKGNPKINFILFLQGDHNSGEIILDLSSLNGPVSKVIDTAPNHLTLIPGWVPYRITKNTSDKELIALVGTFS